MKLASSVPWRHYLGALAISCACTAAAFPVYPTFDSINIIMLYLLGTTIGALRYDRGPCALLALSNMMAFDYFFVPPIFSFDVADTQYLFTMAVMLIVALVIAHLTVNVSRHRALADSRERRTAVLYSISRELAVASDAPSMAAAAVRHLSTVFQSAAVVLTTNEQGRFMPLLSSNRAMEPALMQALDLGLAAEAAEVGELRTGNVLYQPLCAGGRVEGVIALLPRSQAIPLCAEQIDLLGAFAVQLALALRRAHLVEAAEAARNSEERVILRNTLLASISHDLRTPLSAIAGAGSLIAQPEYTLNFDRRLTLGGLIERKARDMSQQLSNILALMQMEHGKTALNTDWHSVEDLVEQSIRASQARLGQRQIEVNLPGDLPLVLVEATLVGQILGNLLENAAKFTPTETTIAISATASEESISLVVEDDGPGLPDVDPERLFDQFRRGRPEDNIVGVGLGLAICRAAVRLHGGEIRAGNNVAGGARFEITLPLEIQLDVRPADREIQRVGA